MVNASTRCASWSGSLTSNRGSRCPERTRTDRGNLHMTPIASEQRSRVLLVAGWGRCGSTLLDMMLGQVPDMVSAGEVREIWLRGCVENRPCGCGHAFRDCPFWRAVGERAYGGWNRLDLETVLD